MDGHELGHEHHADFFDRIDEEAGRKHAAPAKIAHRAGDARRRRVERDREARPSRPRRTASSEKMPTLCCVRSPLPTRWFAVIRASVLRLMIRVPSSLPPPSSIRPETVIVGQRRDESAAARMKAAVLCPAAAVAAVEALLVLRVEGVASRSADAVCPQAP